jgi:glucose/arabinose dehydrogenase
MCGTLIIAVQTSTRAQAAPDASAPTGPAIPPNDPRISYQFSLVTNNVNRPLFVTHAGDNRLFIVEQGGRIKIWANGAISPTAFLNVSALIPPIPSYPGYTEQGLLGLAFEPNYASTGRFYIYYTNTSGNLVIARYHVSSNPDIADPSGQILLTIPHPTYGNHNGGWLGFGPDQYLYAAVGDGGDRGDPYCAAENPSQLLGKILRINVVGQVTYTIPAGNIFTPTQAPQVWAIGLRNPFRNSFDRLTGDLYIADVGQDDWEEVNFSPANRSAGANYGWSHFEGTHPYNRTADHGSQCPPNGIPRTPPVAEYSHTLGCSVTGGYVYRGPSYAWLNGVYFYGDWCSGRVWAMWQPSPGTFTSTQVTDTAFHISSFGEDKNGEIYVADLAGSVYRLTSSLLPGRVYVPVVRKG